MRRILMFSFAVALTGAVVPGPMLALVLTQSLAGGVGSTLFILAGHAVVELVFLLLLTRGLANALANRKASGILSLLGAGVLIWMGWSAVSQASNMAQEAVRTASGSSLPWYALLAGGAGVSLANPYFTGWWATVGTGQVSALRLDSANKRAAFLLGHESGDVAWYMLVSILVAGGRRWIDAVLYGRLLQVCGWAILLLGGVLAGMGAKRLMLSARDVEKKGS